MDDRPALDMRVGLLFLLFEPEVGDCLGFVANLLRLVWGGSLGRERKLFVLHYLGARQREFDSMFGRFVFLLLKANHLNHHTVYNKPNMTISPLPCYSQSTSIIFYCCLLRSWFCCCLFGIIKTAKRIWT